MSGSDKGKLNQRFQCFAFFSMRAQDLVLKLPRRQEFTRKNKAQNNWKSDPSWKISSSSCFSTRKFFQWFQYNLNQRISELHISSSLKKKKTTNKTRPTPASKIPHSSHSTSLYVSIYYEFLLTGTNIAFVSIGTSLAKQGCQKPKWFEMLFHKSCL